MFHDQNKQQFVVKGQKCQALFTSNSQSDFLGKYKYIVITSSTHMQLAEIPLNFVVVHFMFT